MRATLRRNGDPLPPRDLMRGAWLVSMFWAAATIGALLDHDGDDARLYLAFVNL